MTPAERDALITRAKQICEPVVSCVRAGITPGHLTGDLSRDQLQALVIVLADAVDPARLRAVITAGEDGPDITDEDIRLRKAHAEIWRLRSNSQPVPPRLLVLESAYQQRNRQLRGAGAPRKGATAA